MADQAPPVPPKRGIPSPAVNDLSLCDISISPHRARPITSTPNTENKPLTRRFTTHTMQQQDSGGTGGEQGAAGLQQTALRGSVFQRRMTVSDDRDISRPARPVGIYRDSGYCDESLIKDKDSPTKDSQRNSFCSVSSGGGNSSVPWASSLYSDGESITSSQFTDGIERIMDGIPEGDGENEDLIQMINEIKDRSLLPMKEDLADWVSKCLEVDICQDELLDRISNGVLLGKLANFIKSTFNDSSTSKVTSATTMPDVPAVKFQEHAKDGSFHARDNASNFINWARAIGVPASCLFESECLVLQKKPRNVLISLYEVARIASRIGVEPPGLVKLDREIEAEEQNLMKKSGLERRKSLQSKIPISVKRRASIASVSSGSRSGSGGSGGSATPRTKMKRSSSQVTIVSIDNEVEKMCGTCRCEERFRIMKESEGKYDIGGKTVFIRVLGGRHVMVRVGGGWDTLEHYLTKHDPCRVLKFSRVRRSSRPSMPDLKENFMFIKGRYKPVIQKKS